MISEANGAEHRTIGMFRCLILAILLFGMLGVLAELYLIEHNEDWWQLVPMYLLVVGPLAVVWTMARPAAASLRSFQLFSWRTSQHNL